MKPQHFKKITPLGKCSLCTYSLGIMDQGLHVCIKHAFTLLVPLEDYVCDDFSDIPVPSRRPIIDLLHVGPYLKLTTKPITLVIESAWIDSSSLTDVRDATLEKVSGRLEAWSKSMKYEIKFQARNVLVEDTE